MIISKAQQNNNNNSSNVQQNKTKQIRFNNGANEQQRNRVHDVVHFIDHSSLFCIIYRKKLTSSTSLFRTATTSEQQLSSAPTQRLMNLP
jgi:hypothetical protein